MARAQKSGTTAPGDASDDLAADHARLLLEVQRLRLECQGLRHDTVTAARDRDRLLQENIALRQGEHNRQREADLRQREADLRQREADLRWRETTQEPATTALRRQLEASESRLRMALLRISILEMECCLLRVDAHDQAATVPKREIAHQLRELIRLCHPDKWQDAAVATELVKHLNALRAQYTT